MLLKVAALAAGFVAVNAMAQNSTIVWNANGSIVAGSGCKKDETAFVAAAGNDLAIIFTSLGVNLPGGSGLPLAAQSSCAFRVPAQIARGIYIGELTQRITAGVIKTAGSSGSLSARTTFYNFGVPFATAALPYGMERDASNGPITAERKDKFLVNTHPSWYSGWCGSNRGTSGFYAGNIQVQGQRASDWEDIIINVDSLDVKFEVKAALVFCGR